ncbi:hypothetical protein Tco_0033081 [Tanacetum coccineum]
MHTARGDGVADIKRCRRDLSGDDVRNLATMSGCGRLKEDPESSTCRRHVEEDGDLSLEAIEDEEVALVDGVFEGAFGALGDKWWCVGNGVLVYTEVQTQQNNCLGRMMLIFGLLDGLEVEAFVDPIEVMVVDDK